MVSIEIAHNFINFNVCYLIFFILIWMLSRHLTHVGRLMTLLMMKHLVLWSVQVKTGLKRKEKEEVIVLFQKTFCLAVSVLIKYGFRSSVYLCN